MSFISLPRRPSPCLLTWTRGESLRRMDVSVSGKKRMKRHKRSHFVDDMGAEAHGTVMEYLVFGEALGFTVDESLKRIEARAYPNKLELDAEDKAAIQMSVMSERVLLDAISVIASSGSENRRPCVRSGDRRWTTPSVIRRRGMKSWKGWASAKMERRPPRSLMQARESHPDETTETCRCVLQRGRRGYVRTSTSMRSIAIAWVMTHPKMRSKVLSLSGSCSYRLSFAWRFVDVENDMTGEEYGWDDGVSGQASYAEPKWASKTSHQKKTVSLPMKRPTLLGTIVYEEGPGKKGEFLACMLSSELV